MIVTNKSIKTMFVINSFQRNSNENHDKISFSEWLVKKNAHHFGTNRQKWDHVYTIDWITDYFSNYTRQHLNYSTLKIVIAV